MLPRPRGLPSAALALGSTPQEAAGPCVPESRPACRASCRLARTPPASGPSSAPLPPPGLRPREPLLPLTELRSSSHGPSDSATPGPEPRRTLKRSWSLEKDSPQPLAVGRWGRTGRAGCGGRQGLRTGQWCQGVALTRRQLPAHPGFPGPPHSGRPVPHPKAGQRPAWGGVLGCHPAAQTSLQGTEPGRGGGPIWGREPVAQHWTPLGLRTLWGCEDPGPLRPPPGSHLHACLSPWRYFQPLRFLVPVSLIHPRIPWEGRAPLSAVRTQGSPGASWAPSLVPRAVPLRPPAGCPGDPWGLPEAPSSSLQREPHVFPRAGPTSVWWSRPSSSCLGAETGPFPEAPELP